MGPAEDLDDARALGLRQSVEAFAKAKYSFQHRVQVCYII